jgi:hypothetical protein
MASLMPVHMKRIRRAPLFPRTSIALDATRKTMLKELKRAYLKKTGLRLSSSIVIGIAIEAFHAASKNDVPLTAELCGFEVVGLRTTGSDNA